MELQGVNNLVLESRGERNDKRDVELLLSLRRKNAIRRIDLTQRRGSEDANLWVPDQLLGAYAELELGSCGSSAAMGSNWTKIRPSITEIRVRP